MIKRLNRLGNSKGIIIDKALLELLDIDNEVEIFLYNNKIIIEKPKIIDNKSKTVAKE